MPNGGPTPACLHCTWFALSDRSCSRHHFKIGVSLPRLMCRDLMIENETAWVKSEVDLTALAPNLLYLWLEFYSTDAKGMTHSTFDLFPLSFIRHYAAWSEDEEGEMLHELAQAQRRLYLKLGHT